MVSFSSQVDEAGHAASKSIFKADLLVLRPQRECRGYHLTVVVVVNSLTKESVVTQNVLEP